MRRFKKLFVTLLVVATVLGTVTTAFASAPVDVAGTAYEDAVNKLVDLGIVTGFPDGTYGASKTLTRAQAAAIMVRALGLDETAKLSIGATPFTDVPATDWASGYINVAYSQNIITGIGNNLFAPLREVTYQELATMLVRAAGLAKEAVGPWPTNMITVAVNHGLTAGTEFSATKPATRGDTALMAKVTVFDVKNPDTGKTMAQSIFKVGPAVASVTVTGSTATAGLGQEVTFTAKALDADGKEVPDVTFTWSADKGVIDQTGKYASSVAGTVTVTAAAGDVKGTATLAVAGDAKALKLAASSSSFTANGKTTSTITASVVDANGNLVTKGEYTVNFAVAGNVDILAADGTTRSLTSAVTSANGTASITVVGKAGVFADGSGQVAISCSGLTGDLLGLTLTKPVVSSFAISVSPDKIESKAAGSSTTATVKVLDANGVNVQADKQYVLTMKTSDKSLVSFGGNETASVTIHVGDLSDAATVLNATAYYGTVTITGTDTATTPLPVSSATVSTAIAGDAVKLAIEPITGIAADGNFTVKVDALDVNGVVKTTATGGVAIPITLSAKDADGVDIAQPAGAVTVNTTNGVSTFTINVHQAGTVNFEATSGTLVKATASSTVTPGAATKVVMKASAPAIVAANGSQQAKVIAEIKDALDNVVTTATNEVTFTRLGGTTFTTLPATMKVNAVAGVASIYVIATTAEGIDTFSAAATGLTTVVPALTGSVQTKITGLPNKLDVQDTLTNVTAGANMTVKVNVLDAGNTLVSTDQGRAVSLEVTGGTATGVTVNGTQTTVDGVATFTLTTTGTGTVTVKATSTGLTPEDQVITAQFVAGTASKIALVSPLSSVETEATAYTITITGEAQDQYGNAAAGVVAGLNFQSSVGTIDLNTGVWSPGKTAGTASIVDPNSVATVDGNPVSVIGLSIPVYNAGPADHVAIPAVTSVAAGTARAKVTVQVLDSDNKVKTSIAPTLITLAPNPANASVTIYTVSVAGVADPDTNTLNGVATFYVANTDAETATFQASAAGLTAGSGTATYNVGDAADVAVTASPVRILSDGSSVAQFTARVVDANGNTATSFSGTMNWEITAGADWGTLLQTSTSILNGVAYATVQAKSRDLAGDLTVKASTTIGVASQDGSATIEVGNPWIVSAVASNTGVAAGVVEVGDTVVVTFSKAMNPATVTVATIDTDLALTLAHTWGGAGLTATWSAGNTVLTIVLGAAPTVLLTDTITPAVTVTDAAGNHISGTMTLTGAF